MATLRDLPQTKRDPAVWLDAQESVVSGGRVEISHLGISEERVWPPDSSQHLVADTQLVLVHGEVESRVMPVLSKVEI